MFSLVSKLRRNKFGMCQMQMPILRCVWLGLCHACQRPADRARYSDPDQTEQAWCLTVLTNAVITWTTEYYQIAVQDLRAKGRAVPDEILAHISPAHSENINFFGVITVDVEAELAKLDPAGWRPLRPAAPDLNTLA